MRQVKMKQKMEVSGIFNTDKNSNNFLWCTEILSVLEGL